MEKTDNSTFEMVLVHYIHKVSYVPGCVSCMRYSPPSLVTPAQLIFVLGKTNIRKLWFIVMYVCASVSSFPGLLRLQFLIALLAVCKNGVSYCKRSKTGAGEGLGTRLYASDHAMHYRIAGKIGDL